MTVDFRAETMKERRVLMAREQTGLVHDVGRFVTCFQRSSFTSQCVAEVNV